MIILSRNECPYPPSPKVREYVEKYVDSLNRYDVNGLMDEVVNALSNYVGLEPEYLHLISGSESLFVSLPWFILRHGYRFIYSSPTFTPAVNDLRVWGLNLVDVPLTRDYRLDVANLLRYSGDSILYIVNPNNPTGNKVAEREEIEELLESFKLVIVDEAYYEFSGLTCIDLVKHYDNLVVLRSFSKAFCLAGARLGYVAMDSKTYNEMFRARRKYDIPITSLAAGLGALNDIGYMRRVVEEILETKKWVVKKLKEIIGVYVIDTLTNFILVGVKGVDSSSLRTKLLEQGIDVKELKDRLTKYVRVSIGSSDEMKYFLNVLEKIVV